MTASSKKVGLLAGISELPLEVAKAVENSGKQLYVAAFKGAADPAIEVAGRDVGWFRIGHLQALLDALMNSGVRDLILAGKIPHEALFSDGDFDSRLLSFLNSLPDQRGSSILGGFVDLLTSEGFQVKQLIDMVPQLVPKAGHIAGPSATSRQIKDAQFGWRIAKSVANMDIGQTVVIKDLTVVAVEAMEGTDGAIKRAGRITGGGNVVVKVSSPDHDFRFDVPTVGPDTAVSLAGAGGGVIVVEAGRCFLMGLDNLISTCSQNKIPLIAMNEEDVKKIP
ncbi:LpxI family protein [bacterium]|nr:MAG: LpxI family protein [bacterium]